MTYARVYKNINGRAVEATKHLLKSGFWKKETPVEKKIEIAQEWIETVAPIYNVPIPKFEFSPDEYNYMMTGGGVYIKEEMKIILFHKMSLVTLLHEFRHHWQFTVDSDAKLYRDDIEEDARAWSVSLFKKAAPKSYRSAVERGIIHFS